MAELRGSPPPGGGVQTLSDSGLSPQDLVAQYLDAIGHHVADVCDGYTDRPPREVYVHAVRLLYDIDCAAERLDSSNGFPHPADPLSAPDNYAAVNRMFDGAYTLPAAGYGDWVDDCTVEDLGIWLPEGTGTAALSACARTSWDKTARLVRDAAGILPAADLQTFLDEQSGYRMAASCDANYATAEAVTLSTLIPTTCCAMIVPAGIGPALETGAAWTCQHCFTRHDPVTTVGASGDPARRVIELMDDHIEMCKKRAAELNHDRVEELTDAMQQLTRTAQQHLGYDFGELQAPLETDDQYRQFLTKALTEAGLVSPDSDPGVQWDIAGDGSYPRLEVKGWDYDHDNYFAPLDPDTLDLPKISTDTLRIPIPPMPQHRSYRRTPGRDAGGLTV